MEARDVLGWLSGDKESERSEFMFVEYFVRGSHHIPVFQGPARSKLFFLTDCIDSDMFLRYCLSLHGKFSAAGESLRGSAKLYQF